jgi:prepilin-type N-terminal cleavage/methylation domain-containing protein
MFYEKIKRLFSTKGTNIHGFTLIELLIVIGIACLLIALLMPAIGQSLGAARRMACKTNLHSIGIATNQYVLDYGKFSNWRGYRWTRDPARSELEIRTALDKYIENSKVFHCPADTQGHNNVGWYELYDNSYGWHAAYNNLQVYINGQRMTVFGYATILHKDGSTTKYKMPLMNDVVPNHSADIKKWPDKTLCLTDWGINEWLVNNPECMEGFNSLWLDGHIESNIGSDYFMYIKDMNAGRE